MKNLLLILLIIQCFFCSAQKSVTTQRLLWYGYFSTLQFNDKWNLQTEAQERHFVDPAAQNQFLVRSHLTRGIGNNYGIALGICLFLQSPNDPKAAVKLTVPELRPYLDFTNKQKLRYFILDHRYRVEARFYHNSNPDKTALEKGYGFGNFRVRYRLQATIPIIKGKKERAIKIKIYDEIHVNAGKKIVQNVYEQNRIYGGFSFDANKNLSFDVGYLNWFQQRPTGNFYHRHILAFGVFHKVNIQKSSSSGVR